ncbi:MAG: hypothetical protein R3F48_06510 [Candidatus Zixiibacteriota bacterium]
MAGNNSQRILLLVCLLLSALSLAMIIVVFSSMPPQPGKDLVKDAKRLAGELADNNLPQAAIDEYKRILEQVSLSRSERGAINYLIGKVYFEDIGDYEQAASYYIRARSLDENASYASEAGKNLITSLERLGRKLDARRELEAQASLEPDTTTGKLVAIVGDKKITIADFNQAFDKLPKDIAAQYSTLQGKKELLSQIVGRELIFHAALREGFDRDADVTQALKDIEKDYLVRYYSQKKIAPSMKPDTSGLNLYYNANKAAYGDKAFDDVRDKVTQDYMQYLSDKTVREYVDGLLQVEHVQTFEENLK